ncbi:hypothetical protein [Achromobacter marplatensis]|uniref:Uncharacterized protein n=1 Tax=Achromobacter marplatensis TaxID=470868 RepID=A0AA42WF27_9BURK|nr:hypothetical protein [Achromobacter marplatensis]MDH2052717.1 hypothetical protein [Achromobacter marplatensis]
MSNAGFKQVYSTAMIYAGKRKILDEKIGEEVGVRPYIDIPESWILEIVGGHYVDGIYRHSNEAKYNQEENPVVIGYDDSGGPGVDFSNLTVSVEKIRRTPLLDSNDYSIATSEALRFLKN